MNVPMGQPKNIMSSLTLSGGEDNHHSGTLDIDAYHMWNKKYKIQRLQRKPFRQLNRNCTLHEFRRVCMSDMVWWNNQYWHNEVILIYFLISYC